MVFLRLFLTSLLSGLRKVAARASARSRVRTVEAPTPQDQLEHLFASFERLYTAWRTGTLPQPRESADPHGTEIVRLPRRRARALPRPSVAARPSRAPARIPHTHGHSSRPHPVAPGFAAATPLKKIRSYCIAC